MFMYILLHFSPQDIWLDWLKDEICLNEDKSNRETVYELFERAVKDYICKYLTAIVLTLHICSVGRFYIWTKTLSVQVQKFGLNMLSIPLVEWAHQVE